MLSVADRELLEFETTAPTIRGRKDDAIRARFGYTPTRYAQLLNRIIDEPDALRLMPELVYRLRANRANRVAVRASQMFGNTLP